MTGAEPSARRLAGRLNLLPIALFGLWSIPAKAFWLIALGVIPWFEPVPAWREVLPWFLCSFLSGPWVLALPASFHVPRAWEARGTIYRMLGIEYFRTVVANGDLVNRFVRARHGRYSVYGPDIKRLVPRSIWNEKRHIAYLCWGFFTAAYAAGMGWSLWALWLAGSNVGANLYPTMLQRYSRARVMRIARLARQERSADMSSAAMA